MAQEGVKFLYNALPALGLAAGTATDDVEPVSMPFRDEVITLDASPDALRSEAQVSFRDLTSEVPTHQAQRSIVAVEYLWQVPGMITIPHILFESIELDDVTCSGSLQDGSGTEQRQPSGGEPADDEDPGFGGFGDFFALEDPPDAPAADATPAKAAAGATLEQGVLKETLAAADDSQDAAEPGQLPWARASRRIRSPLLRLHNGGRFLQQM